MSVEKVYSKPGIEFSHREYLISSLWDSRPKILQFTFPESDSFYFSFQDRDCFPKPTGYNTFISLWVTLMRFLAWLPHLCPGLNAEFCYLRYFVIFISFLWTWLWFPKWDTGDKAPENQEKKINVFWLNWSVIQTRHQTYLFFYYNSAFTNMLALPFWHVNYIIYLSRKILWFINNVWRAQGTNNYI